MPNKVPLRPNQFFLIVENVFWTQGGGQNSYENNKISELIGDLLWNKIKTIKLDGNSIYFNLNPFLMHSQYDQWTNSQSTSLNCNKIIWNKWYMFPKVIQYIFILVIKESCYWQKTKAIAWTFWSFGESHVTLHVLSFSGLLPHSQVQPSGLKARHLPPPPTIFFPAGQLARARGQRHAVASFCTIIVFLPF